jgi:phosphoenolpyruvate synthase/pyruvate phosphate dikinase
MLATPWTSIDLGAGKLWVGQTLKRRGWLLYVNLAIAERADEVAALPVDGVGLLRAEFMITDALGSEHPRHLLATGRREEFVGRMAESVAQITRLRPPAGRPPGDGLPDQRVQEPRRR